MSDENYRLLSEKLDSFRDDVDARLDVMDKRLDAMDKQLDIIEAKMIPATWMIASVLVPLSAVALAFVGACAVVIFQ